MFLLCSNVHMRRLCQLSAYFYIRNVEKKNHGVLNAHGVANKEIILPKINPMIGYLIVNTSDSKR